MTKSKILLEIYNEKDDKITSLTLIDGLNSLTGDFLWKAMEEKYQGYLDACNSKGSTCCKMMFIKPSMEGVEWYRVFGQILPNEENTTSPLKKIFEAKGKIIKRLYNDS